MAITSNGSLPFYLVFVELWWAIHMRVWELGLACFELSLWNIDYVGDRFPHGLHKRIYAL